MRLIDLNPQFIDGNGGTSKGVGITFDCPCGCGSPCYVPFSNPLGGGARDVDDLKYGRAIWQRSGDTFDTLTLTPSIHRVKEKGGCGWHGHITNGAVTTC